MTELIWEGKYYPNGNKVAPLRIALPFQTVETVNESTADRERNLSLFGGGQEADDWRVIVEQVVPAAEASRAE